MMSLSYRKDDAARPVNTLTNIQHKIKTVFITRLYNELCRELNNKDFRLSLFAGQQDWNQEILRKIGNWAWPPGQGQHPWYADLGTDLH